MVRISKLALSITLLLSVPCWAMEEKIKELEVKAFSEYNRDLHNVPGFREANEQWTESLKKDPTNGKAHLEKFNSHPSQHDPMLKKANDDYNKKEQEIERMLKVYESTKNTVDRAGEPFLIKEKTPKVDTTKQSSQFTKVPQPKQITLLSKEIARDKIAAFKAMMNTNPSIVVVKDLETLKNPDIKKIREVGNYTVFGDSLNHKWVVDNETGIDVALSQEMIEKVMQLSTGDIEFMLKNDAFNEQSIDNILESMNQKQ